MNPADLTHRVCIYGVVVSDGKILISPQWTENGYDFPGGHIDLGEDHRDALVREVREETGFTIKPGNIITAATNFFVHPKKGPAHYTLLYYAGEIIGGEISTSGFDTHELSYAREAQLVTLEEMKKMEFHNEQLILPEIISYLQNLEL